MVGLGATRSGRAYRELDDDRCAALLSDGAPARPRDAARNRKAAYAAGPTEPDVVTERCQRAARSDARVRSARSI